MKRFYKNQILFARSTSGITRVFFFQVTRSTSSTCEVREVRKEIIAQLQDDQEVVPIKDAFISDAIRRKITKVGCIKVMDELHAWPWDGKSQWQTALIFL